MQPQHIEQKQAKQPSRRRDETVKPDAVSVGTTGLILGIGHTTVYKLLKNGTLQSIKIGSLRLVLTESIKALTAGVEAA